ncbi:MAG TPA: polyprenyl synthetase family protein [Anaerolineales bacterium]|nr:polyprenyl synthetase family protein [Anaerolineales bacterium]
MTPELAPAMLEAVEVELRRVVARLDPQREPEMLRMLRHHLGWSDSEGESGGKRVRPLLTLLTCAAAGGDWPQALPAAAAVELIHNFSLVHDDIEDRSEVRRGRRTLWVEWGIAQAINTGDALFALSHLAAASLAEAGVADRTTLEVRRALDEACLELTRGQHLDLDFEDRERVDLKDYQHMIEGKTGALLAAATEAGAILAGVSGEQRAAYRSFGLHLGLAFQVLDDLLGIWGDAGETGKSPGDDLRVRKKSFPVVIGLSDSPEFRERWADGSHDEAGVRAMTRWLEQCGARDRTRAEAEQHTQDALASLAKAAPRPPAADELEVLALRLLRRTA